MMSRAGKLALVLMAAAWAGRAQSGESVYPNRGVEPTGTYSFSNQEVINAVNGNATFTLPLASLPKGRGGSSFELSYIYNSTLFDLVPSTGFSPEGNTNTTYYYIERSPLGGWRYSYQYAIQVDVLPGPINCSAPGAFDIFKMSLQMPDGSAKLLRLYDSLDYIGDGYYSVFWTGFVQSCTNVPNVPGPLTYYTVDGSYIRVLVQTSGAWKAYFPDGSTVAGSTLSQANAISDKNGNAVSIVNTTLPDGNPATQLVDSLQRMIQIEHKGGNDEITAVGPLGSYHVELTRTAGALHTTNYDCTVYNDICPITSSDGSLAVSYPPSANDTNALTHTFTYDGSAYGVLRSWTLPSGAKTTYSYQSDGEFLMSSSIAHTQGITKRVLAYPVSFDGATTPTTVTETTSYSPAGQGASTASMTAPDQGVTKYYIYAQGGWQNGLVYKVAKPDGSTEETCWYRNKPFYDPVNDLGNPYAAVTIKSLPNSSGVASVAAAHTLSVDKNGNPLQVQEYDWAAYSSIPRDGFGAPSGIPAGASLLRSTNRVFFAPTSAAGDGTETIADNANAYWHPQTGAWTLNSGQSTEVWNASGGKVSRTEDSYDAPLSTANLTLERRWNSALGAYTSPLTGANSVTQAYTYDSHGNVLTSTDANQNKTANTYDSNALYLTKQVTASGTPVARTSSFVWDFASGALNSQTDADNNVTTSFGYDLYGRQVSKTAASNTTAASSTITKYEDNNQRVVTCQDQTILGDGKLVSVTDFDSLGRVQLTRQLETNVCATPDDDTAGIKVQSRYQYYGTGRYQLVSNPFRASYSSTAGSETTMGWTVTTMDSGGRVTAIQKFAGAGLPAPWGSNGVTTGTFSSSYNGATTTTLDEAGNAKSLAHDGAGRLVSVADGTGTTTYGYDALDDLTQVTQGTEARSFAYDSLQRLQSAINPESGTVRYTYDGNGNLLTKTDNRGIKTTNSYDALNRLLSKSYSDGTPGVSFGYDAAGVTNAKGRLTSVGNAGATTSYTGYDPFGRVLASSQLTAGQTYTFGYKYNLAGALTSETYPSGRVVTTGYDGANRPNTLAGSVTGQVTNYVTQTGYQPQGVVYYYAYANGVWPVYLYNSRLQMSQSYATNGNSSNNYLLSLNYNWGTTKNNGNLQGLAEGYGASVPYASLAWFNQSFSYDSVNRLTAATDTGWSRTFGYDAYGNWWVTGYSGVGLAGNTPTANVYNTANRITGGSYDLAGNQTVVNGNTLSYDAENRVTAETDGVTHAVETYVYDGDGRRVEKIGPGGTTVFAYDALGQLAAEYSSATNTFSCATCYLTWDQVGSTRLVTGPTGNVVARHDYLPFGEEIAGGTAGRSTQWGAGTDNINQKFTGKERDAESGLDYFGTRYYGSALGRFTSPDQANAGVFPVDPQSWNAYAYTGNNPLNRTDPDGRDWRVCVDNGDGEQTCQVLNDDQYQTLYNQQNGQQGINLPSGLAGNITCGGAVCGSAQYSENSLQDESASIGIGILGGKVAEAFAPKALGWIAGLFGRGTEDVVTGGIGPVLKGLAGVDRAVSEIEAEGGQVVAREVTITNSAGRARVDLVYKDSSGDLVLGEAKNGPTARLNPNQQAVYNAVKTEGAQLVGGNARNAGLPATIAPSSVRVFKY